jgi:RNA polymerase I-specific transcription initiation factor RRN3
LTDQITKKADSPDALSNDQLTHMIQALSIEISRLDSPRCSKLINGVVRLHLEKRQPSQALTDTYYRFLAVLVSAVPRWWSDVATQLVADFTLDDASAQHSALRYMISITPT